MNNIENHSRVDDFLQLYHLAALYGHVSTCTHALLGFVRGFEQNAKQTDYVRMRMSLGC